MGTGMVCITLFGMTLAVDFTAPALLALLSLILPPYALLQTVSACILHECAHLLTSALTGTCPAMLRISAAGLRLEMQPLCPPRRFAAVLIAGPAANLIAAAAFGKIGLPDAAAANLSLAMFNLLPYRSTDGGTLLHTGLEHLLIQSRPELPCRIMRGICCITTALLLGLLCAAGIRNPSLLGMLGFMFLSEMTERDAA